MNLSFDKAAAEGEKQKLMSNMVIKQAQTLFGEIKNLVEQSRNQFAQTVNAAMSMLYWEIGKRIKQEFLQNSRADYGEQIVHSLAVKLTDEYGHSFEFAGNRLLTQKINDDE